MASTVYTEQQSTTKKAALIGGIGFDRLMVVFALWFVVGLFLDGSAHAHHRVDSFFTPWHAVLYSGYLVSAFALAVATFINHQRGQSWLKAIPQGYDLALFGAPLFIFAGIGDMFWHILFGFEVGVAPLLSPTHLLLAFAGTLMMSGPLRAAWLRAGSKQGWATLLPALLSLLIVFSVFTFFTSFAHPSVKSDLFTNGFTDSQQSSGVSAMLLQTVISIGMLLFVMRRWHLPIGTFTLLIGANALLMSVFSDTYYLIPAAVLTGIVADGLYVWLRPSAEHVGMLRVFAFVLPLLYYLLFFGTLQLGAGIPWSIHLWLGSSVMSGVLGLLLSYLLVAPKSSAVEM